MNTVKYQSIKMGNKLRQLRMNKGYSQEYMAEILAVSQKTYSNMENDKTSISIEVLIKLGEEYKVDMIELLCDCIGLTQYNNFSEKSSMPNNTSHELISLLKSHIEDLKNNLMEKEKHITTLEKLLLK
jgi:transcriptional regulator with XRE-family HTH domain